MKTIDGVPSMLGRKSGLTTYVKTVSSNATIVHCFMHTFALCAKVLPEKMLLCLKRVIKLANFVKNICRKYPVVLATLRRFWLQMCLSSLLHESALALQR